MLPQIASQHGSEYYRQIFVVKASVSSVQCPVFSVQPDVAGNMISCPHCTLGNQGILAHKVYLF